MKKIFIPFILCLLIVISGCVAVAPTGSNFNLQSENGLVVFSFVDRALFKPEGGAIAIANDKDEKNWVIFAGRGEELIPADEGKGAFYFRSAELKPGKYRITNWRLHNSSGGSSILQPKDDLIFEVKKGKVIYLGSLNVIRFAENAQFRDRYEMDKPKILKYLPFVSNFDVENKAFTTDWWPLPGAMDMKKIQKPGLTSN